MPKREDEFWAAQKEASKTGLCPFYGSTKVYYNKYFKSWRCGGCEKSFPSPSYGGGGAPKSETGWKKRSSRIGNKKTLESANDRSDNLLNESITEDQKISREGDTKTSDENLKDKKSKAWFGNEYYDSKSRKWKKPGRKAGSVIKIILVIIIILIIVFLLINELIFTNPVS